jgi:hypothetical protein
VIELPDYPWFANNVMAIDEELLDRLVQGESGTVERLLFGRVPLRIFGDALNADPRELPIAGYLWIMHLSGYFGGVWLRREIARAQPEAPILGVDVTPDAAAFTELTDIQAAAVAAALGDDTDALAFAAGQIESQLGSYGYNHGYLTEILEAPPAGLTSPAHFFVAPGLLDARYAVDEIAGLAEHRDRFADASAQGLLDIEAMTAQQAESHAQGRSVWSTGLSVQGFPQAEYEQLLELSAYFLQGTQAAALAAVLSSATNDADLARRAALVAAQLAPWSISYRMGLLDGRPDRALPTLTERSGGV